MNKLDSHRIHGLDFSRAIFMILGIFFHTALIYGESQTWRVTSNEILPIFNHVAEFIRSFRMEAFYIISGFFYLMVFEKGRPGFLKDRVFRALIPMIFCGFLINSAMNYYSYNYSYNLGWKYFAKGQWMGHLWFLGNLIFYFIISLPLCKHIKLGKNLSRSHLLLLVYLIFPLIAWLAMTISKATYSGTVLFLTFKSLLYYYSYFILGLICYRNKEVFISLLTIKTFLISTALALLLYFVKMLSLMAEANEFIISFFNSLLPSSMALAALSILTVIGNKGSQVIRNISDASYTIYLLHQPLIVIIYVALFDSLEWGAGVEYVLLVITVFILSYYFHMIFVKSNQLMRLLFNGVTQRNKHQAKQATKPIAQAASS